MDIVLSTQFKGAEELQPGDIVLYTFANYSIKLGGVPTSPKIYKKIAHLTWDEIMASRSNGNSVQSRKGNLLRTSLL